MVDLCGNVTIDPPILPNVTAAPPTESVYAGPPPIEVLNEPPVVDAVVDSPILPDVGVSNAGPIGPAGIGIPELFDSAISMPDGTTTPYLRFARDVDGDVQAIYLGTAT